MKIYCHNVRVWTRDRNKSSDWYWRKRMARIKALIEQENPDVLCLQELSFPANLYVPKGYKRVCLSISHPVYVKKGIKTRKHRFHIRFDSCEIKPVGADEWLSLVNVHLHWNAAIFERNMAKINKILDSSDFGIACGDFNNSTSTVRAATDSVVLADPNPTFHNPTTGSIGSIDHYVVTRSLYQDASRVRVICDDSMSDHRPIILEI